MKLSNQLIYEYAKELQIFNNCDIKIPVKINFFLQKNIRLIQNTAREIESIKMSIAAEYGEVNEERTGYNIPVENTEIVNKELNDLFAIEQELDIHIFKLDIFDNLELTYQQMSAIMFMIEE